METNSSCESKYNDFLFSLRKSPSSHRSSTYNMPCHSFGNDFLSLFSMRARLIYSDHAIRALCLGLCDDTSQHMLEFNIFFTFPSPSFLVLYWLTWDIYRFSNPIDIPDCRIYFAKSSCNLFSSPRKRCHRCVVIYEKHKNVLQYKESECDEVKEHLCPSALTSRSIIKTSEHDHTSDTRGVVANNTNHPNILAVKQGSSRVQSSSDHRSYDDNYDSKQDRP